MKTALILHGWEWNSGSNWFTWLQHKCIKKGITPIIPNLPNTKCPDYNEQLDSLDIYLDSIKAWDIIIGHSLGGHLATSFVEKHKLSGITLILVAPSYPTTTEEIGAGVAGQYYENLVAYNKHYNSFKTLGNNYIIMLSNDDPFIIMDQAKKYYSQTEQNQFIELKNKGHFNSRAGIMELPEILEFL